MIFIFFCYVHPDFRKPHSSFSIPPRQTLIGAFASMMRNRGYSTLNSLASWSTVLIISSIVCTNYAAVLYSVETDEDPGSLSFTSTGRGANGKEDSAGLNSKIHLAGYNDQERCPPFPDPSKVIRRLCEVKICVQDGDCSSSESVCCFNGCVRSCVPRVQPPPPFDWLEETPLKSYESKRNDDTSHNDETSSSEEIDTRPLTSRV